MPNPGQYDSALDGSIEQFALTDILQLLSATKKSGGLHIQGPLVEGVMYFSAGQVTGATSNTSRHTLGRRLVGRGLVSDEAISLAADALSENPEAGLARTLREQNAVGDAVLQEVVLEQIRDGVFDLMRWTEGDFNFYTDEPNPDDIGITAAAPDLVAEGQKRIDQWVQLTKIVPAPDSVPSVSMRTEEGEFTVTSAEWSLLVLIDGQRSVAELVDLTGQGEFATVSLLAELIGRNLVSARKVSGADSGDTVSALLRRQAALRELEGEDAVSAPAVSAAPEVPSRQAAFSTGRPSPARVAAPPAVTRPPAPAPAAAPKRGVDPQVTQSLLLRLIDGIAKA